VSLRAGAALLIALLVLPVPAAAGAAREAELKELRARIQALQERLADAEGTRSEATDALKDSERAISDANRALRELDTRSRALNRRLAELRGESEQTEKALKAQREQLEALIYEAYVGGQREPLRLLLGGEDPNRVARELHYFGYISRARAGLISDLRANLNRLQALARETRERAAELAVVAREQRAGRERLEREQRARSAVLARLSREIQQQRREIGTLRRDEARLAKLVEEIARLAAQERARPRLRSERVPDAALDGTPFAALKGRLNLPVRGELANRFGSPRSDGGVIWRGLFILAQAGEAVRAVAAGRVVFADWLRGFGNLLIVDHGGAYMSLYGNNETLYRQVGDVIRGGETIARVGASGGNPDSGLYFELRHQGKPLDPLGWIETR
jgi:murein hydrolase activator